MPPPVGDRHFGWGLGKAGQKGEKAMPVTAGCQKGKAQYRQNRHAQEKSKGKAGYPIYQLPDGQKLHYIDGNTGTDGHFEQISIQPGHDGSC